MSRLSLAASFARSWLSYTFGGPPRPMSAAWAITWRCNLRCRYCNTPFLESSELDVSGIDGVLGRLARMGVRRIGYAGGEPLLREDIGEIVRMTHERGFYVTLNTNLTRYRDHESVFDRVDLVFTSLDGDRRAHEANRGARSWDGVLEAMAALVGRRKKVIAIAVVTGENLDQLDGLLDLADRVGFTVHLQPHSIGADCARGPRSDELTNRREREFWREVLARKRAGRPVASSTAYLEALSEWEDFAVTAVFDPQSKCAGGRGFLYIDPAGRAAPCAYLYGKTEPVDLTRQDWREGFAGETPCTRCSAGPYLEFNTLYQRPIRSAWNVAKRYV